MSRARRNESQTDAVERAVDDLRLRGYDIESIASRLRRDKLVDADASAAAKVAAAFYGATPTVEEVCDHVGSDTLRRALLLNFVGVLSVRAAASHADVPAWVLDSARNELFKVTRERRFVVSKFADGAALTPLTHDEIVDWLVNDATSLAQHMLTRSARSRRELVIADKDSVIAEIDALSYSDLRRAFNNRVRYANEYALLRRGERAAGKTARGATLSDEDFNALSHLLKLARSRRRHGVSD